MSKTIDTTRRSFLKVGALVAAPAAAIGIPVAAMAEDGSKAALARLQDERAIEALNRDFLRAFNRGGAKDTASLFADRKGPAFAKGVSKLSLDLAEEPRSFAIAEDGATATARYDCTAEIADELAGKETLVQMARMQGNSAGSQSARVTLSAQYAKRGEGWLIASLDLA
ncbi:hypothetical protein [Alteraurantiacibacter aquimixticola]|uniref:DUF4440 domain-containing protein n=1 Tax=Alteraurantiacibacter aquimixticola TaxID=2489173 RepID=A0A4T3F637_9SPHN|nr:hypothetical protein [Alteraurantiacibacter aquimixticola]TIX51874.1 hypothetical protein E5222_05385 [Alteraurantiacibacter aquimixticola]